MSQEAAALHSLLNEQAQHQKRQQASSGASPPAGQAQHPLFLQH